MIQLEEVHIEHVRGIRDLTLEMNRKSFAIHGPNGSGKSGVVDAIEFGLTGDMTRLSGRGTGGLSVKTHGPHVDTRDYPNKSFVRLRVYLPRIDKTATLTRRLKAPTKVELETEDPEVRAELEGIRRHPEVTLTRRQIASFILTEAGNRAKDVQALLRLEAVDQIRASLKSAQRTTVETEKASQSARDTAEDELRRHLDVKELSAGEILQAVNQRRQQLGAAPLEEWSETTMLMQGLADSGRKERTVDKTTALRDLSALMEGLEDGGSAEATRSLLKATERLNKEPEMRVALQRRSFVEQGLLLAVDAACPLCDTDWPLETLRAHLEDKLRRAKEAQQVEEDLQAHAGAIRMGIQSVRSALAEVVRAASALEEKKQEGILRSWDEGLVALDAQLRTVDGIVAQEDLLRGGWTKLNESQASALQSLKTRIQCLPDLSERSAANNFLVRADERLQKLREAERVLQRNQAASAAAMACHNAYSKAAEDVLETLYREVQREFSESYRDINNDDEKSFSAELQPAGNKLELSVDFHKRGQFPPGAYHSEGHQDGMGLCLYLALMRQLFGEEFRFAVLDDVVMSVDKQHRRELCTMLRNRYPETQLVITTHEQAWFHQMQQAGLVERGSAVTFRNWTVEEGPRTSLAKDAWEDIEEALDREDVPAAAGRLRRYLEFVSGELADSLVAEVAYRLDADHDLGQLLPKVTSRFQRLLKKGLEAAKKWKDADAEAAVRARSEEFSAELAKSNVENWAVNKAVHYNEWADFSKEDFVPVVEAYRTLLDCMRCSQCKMWLYVTPKSPNADALRCKCGRVSVNITKR